MSAVGRKLAVVSLGMSCQSTYQIRLNVPAIAAATGDDRLAISGMPFDGIVCPPQSASRMLATDTFFPADNDELTISTGAFWKAYNVHFRHEYKLRKIHILEYLRGRLNVARAHRDLVSRYSYLAGKFRNLRQVERLVFVMSNTQNDLVRYKAEVGTDYVLTMGTIGALCDQCDDFFGRRCEYIFSTHEDRTSGTCDRPGLTVFKLTPDPSEWKGDDLQWKRVFEAYFGRVRPRLDAVAAR
jgi:hypothetical protein